ncbi:MAG: SPOR domain-containing protein, partial [Planctomycetaceae bacterium]
ALFLIEDPATSAAATETQPANQPKDESPEAIRKRLEAKATATSSFGGLFVIETGGEDASLRKILDTLERKLTESGYITRRDTISGTSLTRIIRANNARRAVEYFSRDGATVIGIGSGAAEAALQRWNGESTERTLAESTDFAAVMGRCIGAEETRPQITFFVDPYRIAERAIKGSGGGAAFVWPMVESLGIGKIRGIGGSVFQGGEMFDDISHMHVLIDPPRDGIFAVVRPSNGDTNPPAWVPEDVASYMSLNWRVDKSFDGFERIFERFSGDGSFATRVLEPYKKATGLDLRESLINTTKDRLIMITWLQRPVTFNSNTTLVAVQLQDPAQTTQTIDTLRQTIWKSVQTDTLGATKIYVGRGNRNPDRNLPPTMRTPEPCGAIVGDWLMVSDSRQLLEHVIRADSGSVPRLSSQPEYDLVASELGAQLGTEQPFMFSFSRDSEALRQVYELAKSPNVKEMLRSRGDENPAAKRIAELIEKNELPPFDEFKKYFAPSGSFAYDEPTGIHFGRYTLKPD